VQVRAVPAVSVVVFLGLWQLAGSAGWVSPVLVSTPDAIAVTLAALLQDAAFRADLVFTLGVYGTSLLLALVCGGALGILIGTSPVAYQVLSPFIVTLNALPKIVLMPLVVLWFGIGVTANLVLGTLMAAFPIMITTFTGVRTLEGDFLLLARAFRASRSRVLFSIILPGVRPYVISGLRVAVNYGMVGVLIAEFFASSRGLGYRMMQTMSNFLVDAFFACLVIVAAVTLAMTAFAHALERRVGMPDGAAVRGGL
jgi:NitT/TauT family transport system permease protein